jgi:sRNA-binding carbon storage regulator CsrA
MVGRLILTRCQGDAIAIIHGNQVTRVEVVEFPGGRRKVRLAIEADDNVRILRAELLPLAEKTAVVNKS